MTYATLRFEGVPEEILEKAIQIGLGKTKSEVIRLGLLKLNEEYHLIDNPDITDKEIELMEELIEKSIKTGKLVSEKELFSSMK